MFEKLNTPEEIFSFKLGSALTMEHTVLESLGDLEQAAQRPEIKELFRHHAEETRQQIKNIETAFQLLGEDVDDSPCPAMKAITKEGAATLKKTDPTIADAAVLAGAGEVEHHEIAVYETLVTNARARGADEVAGVLQQNLDQELHALDQVHQIAQRISFQGIAVPTT